MASVEFEGRLLGLQPGESVLDCLLRHGHEVASGCRSGVCQACLMVGKGSGSAISAAQQSLSAARVATQQFLSCCARPLADEVVQVRRLDSAENTTAVLLERAQLSANAYRLRFSGDLDYRAGQFVTLWHSPTLARAYSLASVPTLDPWLEIHVRRFVGGAMSEWLCSDIKPGESVTVQGPMGSCVYTYEPDRPMLLAAMGTGLAPILGVLREALAAGHRAPIHLFAGARDARDCYQIDELHALANEHRNLSVSLCALHGARAGVEVCDIYSAISRALPDLRDFKAFLCGAETFVRKLRRQCFIAGARMADIASDAFVAASTSIASTQKIAVSR